MQNYQKLRKNISPHLIIINTINTNNILDGKITEKKVS